MKVLRLDYVFIFDRVFFKANLIFLDDEINIFKSVFNLQGILVLAYLSGLYDVSSVIATLTFGDRRRFS